MYRLVIRYESRTTTVEAPTPWRLRRYVREAWALVPFYRSVRLDMHVRKLETPA